MRRCAALVAGVALTLEACSIGRPIPAATTYSIEPLPPPSAAAQPLYPERLRVERVRVAAPYDRPALVYRQSAVRYAPDPYNEFLGEPGAMLGNRIAEWLAAARLFSAVAGPGSSAPAPLVLEVTVTELYGDFQKDSEPAAVMSLRFTIVDLRGARPKVTYERAIAQRVHLTNASPEALVGGYDAALAGILSQLALDLAASAAR